MAKDLLLGDINFKTMLVKRKILIPELVGAGHVIDTVRGERVKYLNLDNAATTPPFKSIETKLGDFLETYGSIHRGSGYKSQVSTVIFEEAIPVILDFLGASPEDYALTTTHNTTSAINKLTRMLDLSAEDTIFLSEFEHSANDLPWRKGSRIVRIPADETGQFDIGYFEDALQKNNGKGKKFVAVSGASNITGAITPVHEIAKLAHGYGATIMVDAAQLAAHREIDLHGKVAGEEIDFILFSGHKMYAPYGGGVLIGRREILERMAPDDIGGGNVDFVTPDSYDLSKDFFKRVTAGTPNALGLVSMALSCVILKKQIGFECISDHEQAILNQAKEKLPSLASVQTYCDLDYDANKKCSILTFNVDDVHPNLVAARLGHEFGIGVRQGAICQFSYVAKLLGLDAGQVQQARQAVLAGDADHMFGIVRASFGLENEPQDVNRLMEALLEIVESPELAEKYYLNSDGEYWPIGKPEINVSNFYKIGGENK